MASAANIPKHVLLSGPPGIGKTTLVMKVYNKLQEHGVPCQGFYTEEIRQGISRIGFDIVTLDGLRGTLASVGEERQGHSYQREYKVGKYLVERETLETLAVPALHLEYVDLRPIYIIDEIGKMESFSRNFLQAVRDLFQQEKATILATVPITKGRPIHLVEELTQRNDARLYYVSRENRDELVDSVFNALLKGRETEAT